jgi:hypothetical protein
MGDTSYVSMEMLLNETAELGRELQNLRLRITVELLVSTFVLIYAFGSVRMFSGGVGILPFVLNAVAWTYWGFTPLLRSLNLRPEIERSDTNDEYSRMLFRLEIRTQRLRRDGALARQVDLLIALQFVALIALIVLPAF